MSDNVEIDAIIAELDAARNAQQADEVLALANARLEEGDLLNPANDNARYYYELVLSNDPQNTAARQGLSVIANKLVLQARSEIDNNNFDSARGLLNDARAVDPENAEVTAATGALVNAQDALVEQQRRQAEAERLAELERQAAEARAEAERQAAADRAAAEARAEAERQAAAERAAAEAAAAEAATDSVVDDDAAVATNANASEAAEAGDAGRNAPPATQRNEAMAPAASQQLTASIAAGAPSQIEAAQQNATPSGPAQAAFSTLNRIKYVAPKYPRSAERRNLSGWVEIAFTVTTDGTAKDVEVRNSEPGDTFDNAAIKAVEKWQFEPVYENGVLVEKRTGVRMMFALE